MLRLWECTGGLPREAQGAADDCGVLWGCQSCPLRAIRQTADCKRAREEPRRPVASQLLSVKHVQNRGVKKTSLG